MVEDTYFSLVYVFPFSPKILYWMYIEIAYLINKIYFSGWWIADQFALHWFLWSHLPLLPEDVAGNWKDFLLPR